MMLWEDPSTALKPIYINTTADSVLGRDIANYTFYVNICSLRLEKIQGVTNYRVVLEHNLRKRSGAH